MTYGIASLISCLLLPLFGWAGMAFTKRTIYRPIAPEEGLQRDEQGERDKVKAIREKSVKRTFSIYGLVVSLFVMAALAEPAQKVKAALWPTATPTLTVTPSPTITRTPSLTPLASRTPTVAVTGASPSPTITLIPSGSVPGGNSVSVIVTRVVVQVQTRIVPVYMTVINYVPITVVVTVTETPPPTATVDLFSHTPTASPTLTPTITPTPTFTETPTP